MSGSCEPDHTSFYKHISGVISGLCPELCMSNMKSLSLTILLELFAFNVPTVWPVRCVHTDRRTVRSKHYLCQFTLLTWWR